MLAQPAANGSG